MDFAFAVVRENGGLVRSILGGAPVRAGLASNPRFASKANWAVHWNVAGCPAACRTFWNPGLPGSWHRPAAAKEIVGDHRALKADSPCMRSSLTKAGVHGQELWHGAWFPSYWPKSLSAGARLGFSDCYLLGALLCIDAQANALAVCESCRVCSRLKERSASSPRSKTRTTYSPSRYSTTTLFRVVGGGEKPCMASPFLGISNMPGISSRSTDCP